MTAYYPLLYIFHHQYVTPFYYYYYYYYLTCFTSTQANELIKINGLDSKIQIKENQTLLIPLRKSVDLKKLVTIPHIKWPIAHTVRGGESLRSLARYYRTTVCFIIPPLLLFPSYLQFSITEV